MECNASSVAWQQASQIIDESAITNILAIAGVVAILCAKFFSSHDHDENSAPEHSRTVSDSGNEFAHSPWSKGRLLGEGRYQSSSSTDIHYSPGSNKVFGRTNSWEDKVAIMRAAQKLQQRSILLNETASASSSTGRSSPLRAVRRRSLNQESLLGGLRRPASSESTAVGSSPENGAQLRTCSISDTASLCSGATRATSSTVLDLDFVENHEKVSVLFLEVMDYEERALAMSADCSQEWMGYVHEAIEDALLSHHVRRVETRSNCLICIAGTNCTQQDSADTQMARIVAFAREANMVLESCKFAKLRFGVAVGPVALSWMSGQRAGLLPVVAAFGDVVNTAARMASSSDQGLLHMTRDAAATLSWEKGVALPALDADRVKSKGWMETCWFDCAASAFVPRPASSETATLEAAALSSQRNKGREPYRRRQRTGMQAGMISSFSVASLAEMGPNGSFRNKNK